MIVVNENIFIPDSEINISFSRSSGPGGQNVNKVNSKATLRWNPQTSEAISPGVKLRFLQRFSNKLTNEGEIVIHSDRFRDQQKNIADCNDKLREMILASAVPPKKRVKTKPTRTQKAKRLDSKRGHGDKKKLRRRPDYD